MINTIIWAPSTISNSGISKVLADAGVSLFVASTFLTDYVLVKRSHINDAETALSNASFSGFLYSFQNPTIISSESTKKVEN